MPGWYIHMETATMVAKRLQAADLPPDATITPLDAQGLGDLAHTWRNYLAAGAIGPDIFFLLPDFKGDKGNVLLTVTNWVLSVWDTLDSEFVSKWETWAQPAIDGVGNVLNQTTGGVLAQLGQAMQELSSAITDAIIELLTQLYDWFGLLTSGVPQGYGDSAFFWSDMFHYRKTFEFAKALYDNATTPQHKAFAIGWMSHCATDVTGHSFVNSKAGGPYRLHWQRHHLVENHMDAKAYDALHHGTEPYGELDTSALHFRLAFRKGLQAPYIGADDAPAYDYFSGFPAYDTSDSAAGAKQRSDFFDLDTADLPDDLCKLIIDTMEKVYGTADPKILNWDPIQFSDVDSTGLPTGRPSVLALQNTFKLLYLYVKKTSTSGYAPRKPTAPPVINDHTPPAPPGSSSGVNDDPSRGGDPSNDSWNLLDIFLALLGFLAWLAELGVWLVTLPAAVLADLATWPIRELLYEYAVVPLWSLYIAARKPLVMQGFLVPKAEEIMQSLVELGISPDGPLADLAAALNSPDGFATAPLPFDENSGHDRAYPRAIVEDPQSVAEQVLGFVLPDPSCGQSVAPSEYLRPWKYPEHDNRGNTVGWEAGLTASGPWTQGQDARVLMNHTPGDPGTRTAYEKAATPDATDQVSSTALPAGHHLGDPVDYGTYVVSRLTQGGQMPDFNLDADRGYGYHCWDWNRSDQRTVPKVTPKQDFDQQHYTFQTPCTVPEGYCADSSSAWSGPQQLYDPNLHLAVHYLDGGAPDPGCANTTKVTPQEIDRAGMPPQGRKG
ncbi:MAG: zinc dependent phospholipase C family protein [Propionibacterium sp.]|nr:zinc dependent phospholipase C family protein [Propionibacterium sp.]